LILKSDRLFLKEKAVRKSGILFRKTIPLKHDEKSNRPAKELWVNGIIEHF